MTIDEAIENLKYDIEIDMYIHDIAPQLTEWLEELKELRATSCGYSKEDIELNRTAMYNNAIDDFAEACDNQFIAMFGQRYIDMRDIVNIAEQLKVGGRE